MMGFAGPGFGFGFVQPFQAGQGQQAVEAGLDMGRVGGQGLGPAGGGFGGPPGGGMLQSLVKCPVGAHCPPFSRLIPARGDGTSPCV